jgi:hypothetical protein
MKLGGLFDMEVRNDFNPVGSFKVTRTDSDAVGGTISVIKEGKNYTFDKADGLVKAEEKADAVTGTDMFTFNVTIRDEAVEIETAEEVGEEKAEVPGLSDALDKVLSDALDKVEKAKKLVEELTDVEKQSNNENDETRKNELKIQVLDKGQNIDEAIKEIVQIVTSITNNNTLADDKKKNILDAKGRLEDETIELKDSLETLEKTLLDLKEKSKQASSAEPAASSPASPPEASSSASSAAPASKLIAVIYCDKILKQGTTYNCFIFEITKETSTSPLKTKGGRKTRRTNVHKKRQSAKPKKLVRKGSYKKHNRSLMKRKSLKRK